MTKNTANDLAVVERNLTDAQIREKAELLVKSGFLPAAINTVEKALAVIMMGRELGLGLMESLRSINVIQGKPTLSVQLMLALCQRTNELEDIKIEEPAGKCQVTVKRKGVSPHSYTFSMDDAAALGLKGKDNWVKQPKTMLRWRAISGNLRISFADAICGMYTPDEAEDVLVEKVAAAEEFQTQVEERKEEIAATVEGASGLVNPLEVDKLGAAYLKPPFDKAYSDRTIMEIYRDKLPSGDPRGKKYLEMAAQKTKDPSEKAMIESFIRLMEEPS